MESAREGNHVAGVERKYARRAIHALMGLIPPIPRPNEPTAPVRRLLGRIVIMVAIAAFVLAWADDPPHPVPSWALRHVVVWRAEVFVALTALAYVPFVLAALAFHGWLFTGLSTPGGGGQATNVADAAQTDAVGELKDVTTDLNRAVATGFENVGERLSTIEARLQIDPDRDDDEPTSTVDTSSA